MPKDVLEDTVTLQEHSPQYESRRKRAAWMIIKSPCAIQENMRTNTCLRTDCVTVSVQGQN